MVVQFSIISKSGSKLTYKRNTRLNKYFRNALEVAAEEFEKALAYFQANRVAAK